MDAGHPRLIELAMVRYRDSAEEGYIYFWIEKHNNEMVSEVFDNEEDALEWYKKISQAMSDTNKTWKIRKL